MGKSIYKAGFERLEYLKMGIQGIKIYTRENVGEDFLREKFNKHILRKNFRGGKCVKGRNL